MNISTSALILASLVLLIGSAGETLADPPKKPRAMQYSRLWTDSPFTIKPVAAAKVAESPLERDWMLGSIRPSGKGYSVTLINKKDRKDRIRFLPGVKTKDFQLMKVEQDAKNTKNSRVQIKKGTQLAWITYDAQLIKVRTSAAPAKKSAPSKSGIARPPIPGRLNTGRSSGSSSRTRHVPTRGR